MLLELSSYIALNRHLFQIKREQDTHNLLDDEFVIRNGLGTTSKIALNIPGSKSVEVSKNISCYKENMWNT
jgi:hypothetical protein